MAAATDPFTLIHAKLWDALLTFDDWARVVGTGNRIRFDQDKDKPDGYGDARQDGDYPQVAIAQGAFVWDLFTRDSRAAWFTQDFPLILTGPDLNVLPVNAVRWQTVRAIHKAGANLGLPGLVTATTIVGGEDDAFADPKKTAGTNRWLTFLAFRVQFAIKRTDIAAGTFPTA